MNGGSHYTGWFNKSHINYGDYLQGKEFERSIRYGINDQTKNIIASNEQLAREHYKVLEQINEGISSGFTTLSTDISALQDSVDSGFQRIATIFEWGFSEMLVSLGRVNDSLNALIKIAKTPAQTWAYEQFEIARDEFRRGLYQESVESVLRAINGYGSNPGYKTEFRFHFLQGTIRLGSYKNSAPQMVDPSESEAAFLRAARYASNDLPLEAARSLLCAGCAAFTQRKVEAALKHSTDAIALDAGLAEAYFQSAQACCVLGRPQDAKAHLVTSIVYNHDYAVKAASDGDICQYPEMLKEALLSAKNKLKITYDQEKNKFDTSLKKIKETAINGYVVDRLCPEQLTTAYNYENDFKREASGDNIFGYVQASKLEREGKNVIRNVVTSFHKVSSQLIDEEQRNLQNSIAAIDTEISEARPKHDYELIDMVIGGALLLVLLLIFLPEKVVGGVIAGLVIVGIATGGLTLLVLYPSAMLVYFIRKSLWAAKESNAKPKKQQLQQKISALQAVKGRIASFTVQE